MTEEYKPKNLASSITKLFDGYSGAEIFTALSNIVGALCYQRNLDIELIMQMLETQSKESFEDLKEKFGKKGR